MGLKTQKYWFPSLYITKSCFFVDKDLEKNLVFIFKINELNIKNILVIEHNKSENSIAPVFGSIYAKAGNVVDMQHNNKIIISLFFDL